MDWTMRQKWFGTSGQELKVAPDEKRSRVAECLGGEGLSGERERGERENNNKTR